MQMEVFACDLFPNWFAFSIAIDPIDLQNFKNKQKPERQESYKQHNNRCKERESCFESGFAGHSTSLSCISLLL
jgi:hypothetical protein